MSVVPDSAKLKGQTLLSSDGEAVGTIEDVYVDPSTGEAEYIEVKAGGRFRSKIHFVPVARANQENDAVRVPYDKAKITEAPKVGVGGGGGELSGAEESELREYWGLPAE